MNFDGLLCLGSVLDISLPGLKSLSRVDCIFYALHVSLVQYSYCITEVDSLSLSLQVVLAGTCHRLEQAYI